MTDQDLQDLAELHRRKGPAASGRYVPALLEHIKRQSADYTALVQAKNHVVSETHQLQAIVTSLAARVAGQAEVLANEAMRDTAKTQERAACAKAAEDAWYATHCFRDVIDAILDRGTQDTPISKT